jgi:hypothetical protein
MRADENAVKTVKKSGLPFKHASFDSLIPRQRAETAAQDEARVDEEGEERQTETWHTFKTP